MSTEFRVKWLLYLLRKNGNQGFTFWELIFVCFILGILVAIALPNFLSQACKGKQAEGKQFTSAVNKAQQAYYTENKLFVTGAVDAAFTSLGVGIKTQTANYKYSISCDTKNLVSVLATPISPALKGYAGTVGLVGSGVDKTSQAIVCEANSAGTTTPAGGKISASGVVCGNNMTEIK